MAYVKKFEKPYSDGYKDKPDLTTPITADILNMQDRTFESIESFLQEMQTDFPDNVEINNSITVGIKKSGAIKGNGSISSGIQCEASGQASHAEGTACTASGQASHAEGIGTKASEYMAHSEGNGTVAGGKGSHAEGYGTKATADFQHVQGTYNLEDTEKKYAHIVGGGSSDSDRKNIHTIDWNGNAEFAGDVTNGNGVSLDGLDGKIAELASSGISRLIVDSLPTEDIKTNVIYFLPLSSVGENNIYEEYMYINEKWELIGTTQVDLSQYYTKEESDDLLAEKANKTAFENHANDKDIHVTVAEKEKWNAEDIADVEVLDHLTIENSVAGGLKLNQLYGKSEQKQYSGKNLLNFAGAKGGVNAGITVTVLDDNSYSYIGTATNSSVNVWLFGKYNDATSVLHLNEGIYFVKGVNLYIVSSTGEWTGGRDGKFYTVPNEGIDFCGIRAIGAVDGATYNETVYPYIVKVDNTDTVPGWEPYVGGIPSPNPDYPQEIKSVVNPVVKVTGKNLLNPTLQTTTKNEVTCTNNGDGTYTLNGTANASTELTLCQSYNLAKGLKYILFFTKTVYTGFEFWIQKQKSPWTLYSTCKAGTIKTFVPAEDLSEIRFTLRINAGVTFDNVVIKPMVTTDTSATYDDFEPYVSQSVTLTGVTLNAIPVSSGGNVTIDGQQYISDYVDVERGKIVRWIYHYYLGSSLYNDVKRYYLPGYYDITGVNRNIEYPQLCREFYGAGANGKGSQPYIDVQTPVTTEVNIFYVGVTPTEESLTSDQLSALQALQTYYPQTNVSVTSKELPPMVELEYGLNKVGGYTLEALNTAKTNAVKLNSLLSSQNESENTTNE